MQSQMNLRNVSSTHLTRTIADNIACRLLVVTVGGLPDAYARDTDCVL